ncbi:MAG: nucleoside deaminase [Bacteroidales bacterium]
MANTPSDFMNEAIRLARVNVEKLHGGPFGCVIVKDGKIIAAAHNEVLTSNDPTAHAEIVAIRRACQATGSHQLTGCEIYASCEPCPMCLGAIYWSRPDKVYFAASRMDAANAGFDDALIYNEMCIHHADRAIPFVQFMQEEVQKVLQEWSENNHNPGY